MDRVAVAVLGSDPLVCAGAQAILSTRPNIQIMTGDDHDHADLLVVVEDRTTEDTISDIKIAMTNSRNPAGLHCMIVTDHFVRCNLVNALTNGVIAIIPRRELTADRLVSAALSAGNGSADLPPSLQGDLVEEVNRLQRDVLEPSGLDPSGLSPRERDILGLLAEGLDTAEVAAKLCYSERTIKNNLYGLMSRLKLTTRAHAVAYAMRVGAI